MNFIDFEELAKQRQKKFEQMLKQEQEETLKCNHCGSFLEEDKINNLRFFCKSCGISFQLREGVNDDKTRFSYLDENNIDTFERVGSKEGKLTAFDVRRLTACRKNDLISVISLRDFKYDRLYDEWEKASKGDAKAEFFLNQLKDLQGKYSVLFEDFEIAKRKLLDLGFVFKKENKKWEKGGTRW